MIGPMGDDQRPDAPSLEAPSLGKLFGRRKGRTPAAAPSPEQPSATDGPASAGSDAPVDWAPVEAEPAQQRDGTASGSPTPQAASLSPAEEDTTVLPPVAEAPPAAPAPVTPAQDTAPTPAQAPAPAPVAAPTPTVTEPAPAEPARPPRPTLTVDGRVATAVTGLVVGLLVVVLTAGSLALCENVRGVSTCGGGPGFLLLVLVMAGMVVLGGVMLRLAKVPDPTSTSFLAVGLLAVLSLLFLVDVLDEWWMIIVIPLLSTAMFLLSHWVTTQVVDSDA